MTTRPDGPQLVDIDGDAADEVFDALGSRTAREVLTALYEDPRPASELADCVGTSLQNVRYHLEKLREAGLVTVADTWLSARGREMAVYAPASESVVVVAGAEEDRSFLRRSLTRLLGALAVLGLASLAIGEVVRWLRRPAAGALELSGGDGGGAAISATPTAPASALPPELLFFAGGLFALLAVAVWRRYR
ncbi:MAG: ArsR/SmtB family transcription factor [Haloarculaceae archaeon]